MLTKIIAIGNSKGIRIPNSVLKQLNIENQVNLIVDTNKKEILLKPVIKTRDGWNDSFKKMKHNNDDELIIDDSIDLDDWEW